MKTFYLAAISLILISLSITVGCMEEDEKTFFNKDIELLSAWEGVTSEENPISTPDAFMVLNFSDPDYQKISLSNDDSKFTQTPGDDDGYPYNMYTFHTERSIGSIQITWEGYGSQPFIRRTESKIEIYLYNNNELKWDKITSEKWNDKNYDDKIVKQVIEDISKYFGDQNEIVVLILGPYGAGDSNSTLSTDLIELKGT